MKKSFLKSLLVFISIAMVLTVLVLFFFQTYIAKKNARTEANQSLDTVVANMQENESSIAELKQSLNEDYLARARAFSYMIYCKPDILTDTQTLNTIKEKLAVDELHVFDSSGVITYSTVAAYIGFDGKASEQTVPFMEAITNPDFELAQEPQNNATENKLFQYIGVARMDQPGIVQIGMEPQRLSDALKNNQIDVLLAKHTFGNTGFVMSLALEGGAIEAYAGDSSVIGKTPDSVGLPSDFSANYKDSGFVKLNGKSMYYTAREYNGHLLIALKAQSEVYGQRTMQTLVLLVCTLIIFAVLTYIIMFRLDHMIIRGIVKIQQKLKQITDGDLNIKVEVTHFPEFAQLSSGINEMVSSIKARMAETNELAAYQQHVFDQVREISSDISSCAASVLSASGQLSDGANVQSGEVNTLTGTLDHVLTIMNANAKEADAARSVSDSTQASLTLGNQKIHEMQAAMESIRTTAAEISKIISTINAIARQSNLLAMNASVEAARVGVQGRSFAIIAGDIRDLAIKSQDAANTTDNLLKSTTAAIEAGSHIVVETVGMLDQVMEDASRAASQMGAVSTAILAQEESFHELSSGSERIAAAAADTAGTAESCVETSHSLSDMASRLMQLVNK